MEQVYLDGPLGQFSKTKATTSECKNTQCTAEMIDRAQIPTLMYSQEICEGTSHLILPHIWLPSEQWISRAISV